MDAPSADAQILRSMKLLAHDGSIRSVERGAVIFAAGDPGDCLYGLLEGAVELSWGDGAERELLGPGRCFGEGALVQPSHTRQGAARALEACRLLVMDRETFLFALESLPMFAIELLASLEARLQDLRRR